MIDVLIAAVSSIFSQPAIQSAVSPVSAGQLQSQNCTRLRSLKLPKAEVVRASMVDGRAQTSLGGEQLISGLSAFCRVEIRAHPSARSDIHLEVWLPQTWTGRYLQVGNGGFGGVIRYHTLEWGIKSGFATANSDLGHRGDMNLAELAVDPQKIVDFGTRSIGATAAAAKAVVRSYYGRAPKNSYYAGCSDGGRETWMAAQRWYSDFDGFLIGAPENDFNREMATELFLAATYEAANVPFTQKQLRAVTLNALQQCDSIDGVVDGIIEDPRQCHVSLAPITCNIAADDNCISIGQADMLRKLYAGWSNKERNIYIPGIEYVKGTEDEKYGWSGWIAAPLHADYAKEYFEKLVYRHPIGLPRIDVGDAFARARALYGSETDATSTDLAAQRRAGKKIIQYHGWADIGIPAWYSLNFFHAVQRRMGDTSDFYRLFMVPGMLHCGAGSGPNVLGQVDDTVTEFDPRYNLLAALVVWVERGRAPDQVIATKHKGNDPAAAVERTRPICMYPKRAAYNGMGSIDLAENFRCR